MESTFALKGVALSLFELFDPFLSHADTKNTTRNNTIIITCGMPLSSPALHLTHLGNAESQLL